MCLLLATPMGVEPTISAVTGRRDSHLRYGAICVTYLCTDGVTPTTRLWFYLGLDQSLLRPRLLI